MNEAKLHEFMGKFVTDMGGAYMMEMVLIGDELGQTPFNLILEARK